MTERPHYSEIHFRLALAVPNLIEDLKAARAELTKLRAVAEAAEEMDRTYLACGLEASNFDWAEHHRAADELARRLDALQSDDKEGM